MDSLIVRLFFDRWKQKGLALLAAVVVWFLVNISITTTKVLPNVVVRVINIPTDKTVEGLLPNGVLKKRIALTLTGNRNVLEPLESSDLEVILDGADKPDEWVARVERKNLASLNPDIDLLHYISSVTHPDFVLKMSRLVTAKIPILIAPPTGEAPKGYQYLDVWPQILYHTISGPEYDVEELQKKGIYLLFDLRQLSESDFQGLSSHVVAGADEVSFAVPPRWKRVVIPFLSDEPQEINDPSASHLRIDFLKQSLLSIERDLPIRVFYPLKWSEAINPNTLSLTSNHFVSEINGIPRLSFPLYCQQVSRLFLDVIRDQIEIALIPTTGKSEQHLQWSVQFINAPALENEYVRRVLHMEPGRQRGGQERESEEYFRNRFRDYMQRFALLKVNGEPLALQSRVEDNRITIEECPPPNPEAQPAPKS